VTGTITGREEYGQYVDDSFVPYGVFYDCGWESSAHFHDNTTPVYRKTSSPL